MKTAYLSLGSNLGDREAHLRKALLHLDAAGVQVVKLSSVYETEPQEVRNQAWFLNLAVQVETTLFPLQLLHLVQRIEIELGRKRAKVKGPRSIDIDILMFGRFVVKTSELELPHPRMHLRRFVLGPLAEICPQLRHPALRKTVRELLAGLTGQEVRRTGFVL